MHFLRLPLRLLRAGEPLAKSSGTTGAAVDLSGSSNPRAAELERRVVLSQYLTAIQCSGSAPPQETGLTVNSWYGKFHLEMHWWHAAHFALWNRAPLLEKSLDWYRNGFFPARANGRGRRDIAARAGPRWSGRRAATVHRRSGLC